MEKQCHNQKCIKRKAEEVNLVLDDGVNLNEISLMESASLVVHFANKRMNNDSMKRWKKEYFTPILDYKPKCLTLVKGWMA
jgi:hypothetical protein